MSKKEEKQHLDLAEELKKEQVPEKKRKLILKNIQEKLEKEKTMKLSIKEGSFSSVMTGLGDYYIVPFALALNSNNFQIGLLRSFSGLLPPISQLYGSKLMEKQSRKKIIIKYVSLQAFMWLPILLLSLLFWKSLFILTIPYLLVIFYTLYAILGSIAGPSWFSLIGDVVPNNIRGKYFGRRNKITGTVALVSTLVAAFFLDFFSTRGLVLLGFSLFFLLASIARFISASLFRKHYEHNLKLGKKYYFSFLQFIKGYKKYNFTKFSFFVAFMHLATFVASPFFTVYMLKELGFSYLTFMIIIMSSSLAGLLVMTTWGKFSDKYGRKEVIIIGSILVSLMPVLWLFSSSPYYLIFPMILSGVGWAGFTLSSFNFIYDSVTPERRGLCVSYYNILIGIGIFLGSGLGGLILQYLPSLNLTVNKFFIIFILSGVLRALTGLIFLPKIKEVRKVKTFHPVTYFRNIEHVISNQVTNGVHKIENKRK